MKKMNLYPVFNFSWAPIKNFQVRTNYAPWLTQETKDLMAERDKVQGLAAQTRDPEKWRQYKSLRNRINSRLISYDQKYNVNLDAA